jgi:hypothetical protein
VRLQTYIAESSLSRIWRLTTQHDSGTISAFRYAKDCGDGDVYTKNENRQRNAILKAKLLRMGYGVTPIKGVYIENYGSNDERDVNEESFLVVDINDKGKLRDDLIKLGEMFEQDSITYSKANGEYYIIGTNKCPNSYPGYRMVHRLGSTIYGEGGEFHSKVKGRPFEFKKLGKLIESIRKFSIAEIRSIHHLSEKEII